MAQKRGLEILFPTQDSTYLMYLGFRVLVDEDERSTLIVYEEFENDRSLTVGRARPVLSKVVQSNALDTLIRNEFSQLEISMCPL